MRAVASILLTFVIVCTLSAQSPAPMIVQAVTPAAKSAAAPAAAAPIPSSTAEERERRRSGIVFYITIGSLITGSLSTFTDLFGFFKGLA